MNRILLIRRGAATGHEEADPARSELLAGSGIPVDPGAPVDPRATGGSRTLIAITHAFVIGSFLRAVLQAPAAAWLRMPVANAGLTELRRWASGEWAVHSMSDVGHLVALPGASS